MKPYMIILVAYGIFLAVELYALVRLLTQYLPPVKRIKITFRINVVIFCTGLSMLAVVLLFDINYFRYRMPIAYKQWRNIDFEDFRGLKRPGQTMQGWIRFAFIVTSTEVVARNGGFDVTTYFHPARSYVYDNNLSNIKLLKHELYHFHIREYCARMLRKQIAASSNDLTLERAEEMNREMEVQEDTLQARYDRESNHSQVVGKQLMWEKRVDSCLKSMEAYVDPYVKPGSWTK